MRHAPNLDTVQRALRARICQSCPRRRGGGVTIDPGVPLACEHNCPLFLLAPRLRRQAVCIDPMLHGYRHVMNNLTRQALAAYRSRHSTAESSLLRRHLRRAVRLIGQLTGTQC